MLRTINEIIEDFLREGPYAVVGASKDRAKYGNKILRLYQQHEWPVYAINPTASEVEGLKAYAKLADLPEVPRAISMITPPAITEKVIREAVELGVKYAWMQPGAESAAAVEIAEKGGIEVVADGSCLLVVAGYHE